MSKTIFITGASTGIGKASAQFFQSKGWNVVATMRSPEKETDLTKLENVLVTRLDVQDRESIAQALQAGLDRFGKIDVLLNNAGYGLMGPFESAPRENIERQFGVNVFGLFDVTRAFLPHFRENRAGLILNVSSVGGRITFPMASMYHATKWAVEGFSESLVYELAPFGIRVKIIEPGGVKTDFSGRSLDLQHDENLTDYTPLVKTLIESFTRRTQSEDYNTPELVAEVIYNAATDPSETLRYHAGADAEQMLTARKQLDDPAFFAMMREHMGI